MRTTPSGLQRSERPTATSRFSTERRPWQGAGRKGTVAEAERLEYAAVLRRGIVVAALVPVLIVVGCGGGKSDTKGIGGGAQDLAVSDQLRVIQDKYDIDEFCSVIRAPKDSDLYVRAFTGAIDASNDVVAIA